MYFWSNKLSIAYLLPSSHYIIMTAWKQYRMCSVLSSKTLRGCFQLQLWCLHHKQIIPVCDWNKRSTMTPSQFSVHSWKEETTHCWLYAELLVGGRWDKKLSNTQLRYSWQVLWGFVLNVCNQQCSWNKTVNACWHTREQNPHNKVQATSITAKPKKNKKTARSPLAPS